MLEGSVLPENCASGGGETTVAAVNEINSGGSVGEDGDRSSAGNRWPREETLALLKIRSDMDVDFRDSNLKGALWDEVSRKLGELGYHRSAKKCKEKFENIYKYHKRTKEGRSGRQNGKNYRFFDQLEVFDHHSSLLSTPLDKNNQNFTAETAMALTNLSIKPANVTTQENVVQENTAVKNPGFEFMSATSTSATSNSSKESAGRVKKKRKLEAYFESLMKEVLDKQESLQNKFIEAIEKSEVERAAREEAWKMQELARAKKEKEILAQERAVSAAKDAAVIAFLQKISDQSNPLAQLQENRVPIEKNVEKHVFSIGNGTSSSRWPRTEVEALIRLRTNLDYQDNGAKGSLWEEISLAMKKLGYDRSAKRCKEKWENINKYYKRVKESKKKRAEDSKTCPYFHMLESIYEMKAKKGDGSGCNLKAEDILIQMMGQQQQQQQEQSVTDNGESENADQNEEDVEEEEEEDDDNGDDYQVVVNNNNNNNTNPSSTMATME